MDAKLQIGAWVTGWHNSSPICGSDCYVLDVKSIGRKNLTSLIFRKPSETESRLQMNLNRKLRVAYRLSWSSLSSNYRKQRTWSGGRRRFAATDHRGDTACWATVCKTVRPMLSDRCLSCLSCLHVTLVCCGQKAG